MYILTFKHKTSDNFGASGVYDTLKQVVDRIKDNNANQYEGYVIAKTYIKNECDRRLEYSEIEKYLKKNFQQYCTTEIESDNHLWNIREQKDIKRID